MNFKITFSSNEDVFKVGSCEIKIPELSLNRGQEVDAEVKLCINRELEPPNGYVQASSTLIIEPGLTFRKHACILFSTWFSTDDINDIDVTIFEGTKHGWEQVDTFPLTDKRYIEVQLKKLNNITAFLSKQSLPDVKVLLKSYLFKKGKCVKSCFGPDNEVFDRLLKSEMIKIGCNVIKETPEKRAYEEQLPYLIADMKMCDHVGEASELNKYVVINERFLDLKATPIYDLTERESNIIVEETPPEQPQDFFPKAKLEFHGGVDAGNIINNAEDVYIDQRVAQSQQMESFTVRGKPGTANRLQISSNDKYRHIANPVSSTLTVHAGSSGATSWINFFGNVKVGSIVGNANTVTIDQTVYGKMKTLPPQSVEAEADITNPIQVGHRVDESHSEHGTIEETSRTFNSSFD